MGHVTEGVDENGKKILTCLYCGKIIRGGDALNEIGAKNKQKVELCKNVNPYGASVQQFEGDMLDEDCEEVSPSPAPASSTKRKRPIGIGGYFAPRTKPRSHPSINIVLAEKEAKWRVNMIVARLFYDSCIPINVINSIYFQSMVDAITVIGLRYKLSTYHSLRVNLLRNTKKEVQLLVDGYKKTWEDIGCTIMTDGWTDISHRSPINFLVYCPKRVCFVKSMDASDVVKDVGTLFNLFEEIALWVEQNNIVHLVTNNVANYKATGRMLCEKIAVLFGLPVQHIALI
ncbi:uncharacterized protein LOC116114660 [Pistacia vera]|uniref:uncharacterized protein LOC116114660 n=1 Tax=Pistacia vera TaxID=55513 RepID=UPI001263C8B9|nr:uncharacterized protein LOC116114660 [Pistacia vera]